MVVTSLMDGSRPLALLTTQLWHIDAVRGPSTHQAPVRLSVLGSGKAVAASRWSLVWPASSARLARGVAEGPACNIPILQVTDTVILLLHLGATASSVPADHRSLLALV